ncbi:MAG: hypothetical protein ABW043_18580 [Devosia sp.]|uniref:hypothetical protein n=1 Tax=Devosia sp. TaxID=1871048 RepID=UPI003393855E
MNKTVNLAAVLALGVSLFVIPPALAETYQLPIDGGTTIMKIFLDNGAAKLVSRNNNGSVYEVEMDAGECIANLAITFTNAPRLRTRYDVCSEKGIALTKRTIVW